MKVIDYEDGYRGTLQRDTRKPNATWSYTLLDAQHCVVGSAAGVNVNGEFKPFLDAQAAQLALDAAHEARLAPKEPIFGIADPNHSWAGELIPVEREAVD